MSDVPVPQRSAFLGGEGDAWFHRNETHLKASSNVRDKVADHLAAVLRDGDSVLEIRCGNASHLSPDTRLRSRRAATQALPSPRGPVVVECRSLPALPGPPADRLAEKWSASKADPGWHKGPQERIGLWLLRKVDTAAWPQLREIPA